MNFLPIYLFVVFVFNTSLTIYSNFEQKKKIELMEQALDQLCDQNKRIIEQNSILVSILEKKLID